MKNHISRLALATVTILFMGAAAQAATMISVNFQGTHATGLASGDIAGAGSYAAGNWNNTTMDVNTSGSPVVLYDSNNASTSVTLDSTTAGVFAGAGTASTGDSSPQRILFGGMLASNSNYGNPPLTFTLSGLDAFSSYDLVLYYDGGSSFGGLRNATFTASGSPTTYYGSGFNTYNNSLDSYTQSTSTTPGVFPNANYVVFTGLSDASETVSFYSTDWMNLTGFQIAGTVVPEPSSWALLAGGLFLLLGLRRLRSKGEEGAFRP